MTAQSRPPAEGAPAPARVTLLDLGVGNLHSLAKALARVLPQSEVCVEADPAAAARADLLVLPGVGAFTEAAARLAPGRAALRAAIKGGLPCVGICLGMQLLFDESDEGPGEGLSVIGGRVTRLTTARMPHMGYSPVRVMPNAPAWAEPFRGENAAMYYAHSFACRPDDPAKVVAVTELEGDAFAAIVESHNAVGCQFHPEKSSAEGLELLGAVVRRAASRGAGAS